MFQRLWRHVTGRKHRLLSHLMLAFMAGWALLQFDLPAARAQRRMMGMGGGMMMRPMPSMMMRPAPSMMMPSMIMPSMNTNGMGFSGAGMGFSGARMGFSGTGMGFSGAGMGFSGARMGFPGTGMGFPRTGMGFSGARMGSGAGGGYSGGGMSGGYSGGGQYGSQNGYGDGGSTDSQLLRSLDGYLDGSSSSSAYGTSGVGDGYAEGDSASSRRTSSVNGGSDQAYQQRTADRDAREAAKRRAADDAQNARETALAEENRQRAEREQLEHSLHHPSAAEIRSGKALNEILADLQKHSDTVGLAALGSLPLPLDEVDLAHVNVSARAGSIGLLKDGGQVNWPAALRGSDFAADRERVTRRTSEAIQKIKASGLADGAALDDLQGDLYGIYRRFRNQGTDFPPSQYIEGLVFLREFESAIKGLWQLDVANHFNGKYALKAKTVGKLVKHMTEQGLHFAPAVSGDEPAYAMLHRVLADYDRAVERERR